VIKLKHILLEAIGKKIAILFDGTSSAGKSYTAKQLKAVPFYEATNPNQWVVIDSDHFKEGEGEERRLKDDHPNIRDWAKKVDAGITSGIYRKAGEDVPENPREDEYIDGTNSSAWYMAQEFKHGGWQKVIFDDINNDIEKYVPNIKHKLLIHSPIYIMLGNIKSRNELGDQPRNPKDVLNQYLERYEVTTSLPDPDIGDPTTDITKKGLKTVLMDARSQKYPDYDEEYIDGFIDNMGVTNDNETYWIKVKDNYLSDDQVLINVGDDRKVYINKIKDEYFNNEND
jgi:hypothetical protein